MVGWLFSQEKPRVCACVNLPIQKKNPLNETLHVITGLRLHTMYNVGHNSQEAIFAEVVSTCIDFLCNDNNLFDIYVVFETTLGSKHKNTLF